MQYFTIPDLDSNLFASQNFVIKISTGHASLLPQIDPTLVIAAPARVVAPAFKLTCESSDEEGNKSSDDDEDEDPPYVNWAVADEETEDWAGLAETLVTILSFSKSYCKLIETRAYIR